ncbi:hypothetical protein P170DRAFT_447577 [Aspergillus steynii IBT 23096]|uniref:Uncharacterized protein n=1 Tax=Aspergillus steynii IBT 23096 TaxID=1392250 RepID=A0A2I2G434_9EURO|nr:uncharacterized protein P170DRAFT_447577 [Aspergillus steynii IBT 23096]PLB47646.1 hypothetical protein P170DRAFT_447577 [Aspergillus steynii IBT 23096]
MATSLATSTAQKQEPEPNQTAFDLIADYDIHRSPEADAKDSVSEPRTLTVAGVRREAQPAGFDPTLAPHPLVPYLVSNPLWWETQHRAVPKYRPVNRYLDREQRQQGPLFTAVGIFMIGGCSLIANWSSMWRVTAGRVTEYGIGKVGGEW